MVLALVAMAAQWAPTTSHLSSLWGSLLLPRRVFLFRWVLWELWVVLRVSCM
jgi:hypothetical protein